MAVKIRVGIVGATVTQGGSGWGANAHIPALHALPNYELKAVCTAHEDTAKASAEKFGADLAFHDMGEMVAHPNIDLVTVVVRVPWHRKLVMQAIDAKKSGQPDSQAHHSLLQSRIIELWVLCKLLLESV